jgi:hypothetical protein
MPFVTYSIDRNYLDNFKKVKMEDLSNFNLDISDFNLNQKAILISYSKYNVKEYLGNLIKDLSNNNLDDLTLIEKKILLENTLNNINQSLEYKIDEKKQNQLLLDFIKVMKNQIDRNLKMKILEGNFYPEDFKNDTDEFLKNFLGKVQIFIHSQSHSNERKINMINIYHKELSNYVLPNQDSIFCSSLVDFKDKSSGYILKNLRKIEYGVNLLYKWWQKLPENIKPSEFKVLTDIPSCLTKLSKDQKRSITNDEIRFLEHKIEELLFYNNEKNKNKAQVKIIKQKDMPGHLGWKHKRHWILGNKINQNTKVENVNLYAIKSDFGVEIVDEINNSKLDSKMELTIITNKNISQMRDIFNYLIEDAKNS